MIFPRADASLCCVSEMRMWRHHTLADSLGSENQQGADFIVQKFHFRLESPGGVELDTRLDCCQKITGLSRLRHLHVDIVGVIAEHNYKVLLAKIVDMGSFPLASSLCSLRCDTGWKHADASAQVPGKTTLHRPNPSSAWTADSCAGHRDDPVRW